MPLNSLFFSSSTRAITRLTLRNSHNASGNGGVGGSRMPHQMSQIMIPDKDIIVQRVKTKVYSYMDSYEEFIGIKQVKEAHNRVIQTEMDFMKAQELRRTQHKDLNDVQNKLRDIRSDLDRTFRGEDRYLELVKQEMFSIREERSIRDKFEECEKLERDAFNALSNALRLSHEKERAQSEKTKYWSVIGSVCGAVVGIIGTTINSRLKAREMKKVLTETSQASISQIQDQMGDLLKILTSLANTVSRIEENPTDLVVAPENTSLNNSVVAESLHADFVEKYTMLLDRLDSVQRSLDSSPQVSTSSNGDDGLDSAHSQWVRKLAEERYRMLICGAVVSALGTMYIYCSSLS